MTDTELENQACVNTDRELWRERKDDYYANSIFVTEHGGIGMKVGGYVIVKPIADWHKQAAAALSAEGGADGVSEFHEAWGYASEHRAESSEGYRKEAFGHVRFWIDKVRDLRKLNPQPRKDGGAHSDEAFGSISRSARLSEELSGAPVPAGASEDGLRGVFADELNRVVGEETPSARYLRSGEDKYVISTQTNLIQAALSTMRRLSPTADLLKAAKDDEYHGLDTPQRVCFYEQDFYVLSNFSAFNLTTENGFFPTSEHAYHYEKFIRTDVAAWLLWDIRHAPSAHEAFKIAERNKTFRRADWDDVKIDVMRRLLRLKADQHEYVRRKLLATGDRELVENSWRDDFWGWGPNKDGKNMLGKLWMEVRAAIRSAEGDNNDQS